MTRGKRWRRVILGLMLAAVALGVMVFGVASVWRYTVRSAGQKKLDTVIAELDATDPGWRLDDILAAREKALPPDEENIILLVQRIHPRQPQAYVEFGSRHPDWLPEERNQLPATDVLADAKGVRNACRDVIEPARRIRHLTRGGVRLVVPTDPLKIPLPHLQNVRGVVHLLHLDALIAAESGNPSAAVSSLHAGLNAARAIGDEPFMISQAVRMAATEIVVQGLERTLGWTEPPDGLADLQPALIAEADEPLLVVGFRGDRAVNDRVCAAVDDGAVGMYELLDEKPGWRDTIMLWLYRPHLPGNRADLIQEHTGLIAAKRDPPEDLADLLEPRPQLPHDYRLFLYGLLRPDWKKWTLVNLRTKARLRSAAVGIACERFRQKNEQWPKDLAEIPKDILPAVPLDPYDGQPLRYRPTDDGVVVYSVGPDAADDGGRLNSGQPKPGDDVGFRLWDVPHRRAAPPPGQNERQP